MLKIKNSYLVELSLGAATPAAGQQINFKDQPYLREKNIYGIEVLSATQLAVAPSGATMIVAADVPKFTFTAQFGKVRPIENMSLSSLYPSDNSGFYREFNPFKLDFTKSFIKIVDATGLAANEALAFNFFYF